MKKTKILALALAGALACPQVAFAAEDDSGMQYTSASEGLFGSLRTIYSTGNTDNSNGEVKADGSVFGYRGTLDLGRGLTGLYHYEQRILAQDGEEAGGDTQGAVRYNFVGLRGGFGEAHFGSFGSFVAGVPNVTDVTANGGGNFVPFYRRGHAIQYVSPELNGFQAGAHLRMLGGSEDTPGRAAPAAASASRAGCYTAANARIEANNDTAQSGTAPAALPANGICPAATPVYVAAASATAATGPSHGDPKLSQWALAAKYKIRGFQVGFAYIVDPDAYAAQNGQGTNASDPSDDVLGKQEDATTWFASGKYSQDNWSVAAMYGKKNTADNPNQTIQTGGDVNGPGGQEDETYFSVGASIDVGKVNLAVLHDVGENLKGVDGRERTVTALSAIYKFTSRSRVYASYIANDDDSKTNEDDEVIIGMRMDF